MYSFLNDWGIVLRLFWYHFGIVLGSFLRSFLIILGLLWDRFGIILWIIRGGHGGSTPHVVGAVSGALGGGFTPLKYAQMFVVGAALALGGVNSPQTATDIWLGVTPPKQQSRT